MDLVIVFFAAILGGFIGAQVGGGGLINLPVLMLLGLSAPAAVATTRFTAVFLNLSAVIQYIKKGKLDLKLIAPFIVISMIGAVVGAQYTLAVDETILKNVIAGLLFVLLVFTLSKKEIGEKDSKFVLTPLRFIALSLVTFVLGIYGGVIGIAGTTFLAFAFVFFGQSFTQAMGYSLLLSFLLSLAALVVFIINDAVVYEFAIVQAAGVSIGAWFGSRLALKKGNLWVKVLFSAMVLFMGIKLLLDF